MCIYSENGMGSFHGKRFILNMMILSFFIIHSHSFARHSIAPLFSFTNIQTTDDDYYHLSSPAMNYTGDFQVRDYRFYIGLSALLPLRASENGKNYNISEYYSNTMGGDVMIGLAKESLVIHRFDLIPVLGWHQNGIRLQGKSEYKNFYSMTSGISLNLLTKYKETDHLLNFAFLSMSMDFIDLLHKENKLSKGYTFNIGVGHTF